MIRQTDTVVLTGEILSGYLAGYKEAYETSQPFLRFYGNETGGQLALMDGVATVEWPPEEGEELQYFLSAQPDIHTIRTSVPIANRLSQEWGTTPVVRPVMRCEASWEPVGQTMTPSLRNLYPLLQKVFPEIPPFESWYVDVSHRMRHECCHICAVEVASGPVSSAMTVAEWRGGAMIGSVATDERHRGCGYASRCVVNLTSLLQHRGKTVYICPKNEGAQRLYERLGFVVCGETAIVERN